MESRENKSGYVNGMLGKNKRISSRRSSKKQKHDSCITNYNKVPKKKMLLQKLYESCQQVFRGPGTIPSPPHVQLLRQIIGNSLSSYFMCVCYLCLY